MGSAWCFKWGFSWYFYLMCLFLPLLMFLSPSLLYFFFLLVLATVKYVIRFTYLFSEVFSLFYNMKLEHELQENRKRSLFYVVLYPKSLHQWRCMGLRSQRETHLRGRLARKPWQHRVMCAMREWQRWWATSPHLSGMIGSLPKGGGYLSQYFKDQ